MTDNRLQVGDGTSIPMSLDAVQAGDWVGSHLHWGGMAMGQVIERAYHPKLGAGFVVRTIGGRRDFLAESDVRLLGYRDCRPPGAA